MNTQEALLNAALDYVSRGMALTWFEYGQKFPTHKDWNTPGKVITTPEAARARWGNGQLLNIGLVHSLSPVKTCSLDVDHVEWTRNVLAEFGIDLDAWRSAAPCIQGNPDNFRLEYRQPPGLDLPLVKLTWPDPNDPKLKITVFELRAGANQDVLPPSLHPNGQPYLWLTPLPDHPDDHPEPPPALVELWLNWEDWEPALKSACPWATPAKTKSAPRSKTAGANLDIIGQFNRVTEVRAILEANGYQPRGQRRYLPPNSHSGVPSVRILESGKVFSDNGSCPLNDGHAHDAFDCYRILAHGGDLPATLTHAADILGIERPRMAQTADPEPPPIDEGYREAIFKEAEFTEWPEPLALPETATTGAAPYPLAALPAPLQFAVAEVARFVKVPAASPAIIAQAILALAIGKQALIEERPGFDHHPALFFVGIADSGERKSPPVRHLAYPLNAWIDERQAAYEAQLIRVKANHQTLDSAIAGLRKRAAKTDADLNLVETEIMGLEKKRLPPAVPPRMFTSDPTEQRLFQLMEAHGGSYGVLSGEGRPVFDAILGKYSGDGMNGDAIYLAGISGDTITRDRVGSVNGPEDRYIRRPCLNVAIMVQPDKYREIASHPGLRASGAIARIWPVWFPSMVGSRLEAENEPGLNSQALQAYNALVYALLNADRDLAAPHRVTLGKAATAARRELHNAIETMMQSQGDLHDVRDIASKAITQIVKLALVFHLASDPGYLAAPQSELSLETWNAAQVIGIYHLTEAVRVQRLADEDQALLTARRILDWLCRERRQSVTSTTLMQFSPRPRPSAVEADRILDLLEEHHCVRPRTDPARRKAVWEVNPRLFSQLANLAGV